MKLTLKTVAAVALVLPLVLLSACASESFTSSTSTQYPAWRGEVEVLKQLPAPGKYDLIGIVRIEGANITSEARMFSNMKAQAAARGANAVVPQSKIQTRTLSSGDKQQVLAAYAIRLRK